MRNIHIIAYDIMDPKRYRRVYRTMCGHGDPLQYSVFRCPLSAEELQQLKDSLWPLLNLAEDRIMIVRLGPVDGGGDDAIEYWGTPKSNRSQNANFAAITTGRGSSGSTGSSDRGRSWRLRACGGT